MDLKKRSIYYLDQDDEEEDEWEREASSSSTQKSRSIKPLPPNPYAAQIDILDKQYELINTNYQDLSDQLEQLQASLDYFEKEEASQKTNTDKAQQKYMKVIEDTISLTLSTTKDVTALLNSDTPLWKKDTELSNKLKSKLAYWQNLFEEQDQKNTHYALVKDYKSTQFDLIDLNAQILGYEARIQQLNTERSKLNGLPKMLPILISETENYMKEMQQVSKEMSAFEKNMIQPCLTRLAEIQVVYPSQKKELDKELEKMEALVNDLEAMYKILIKQRAFQQLITYISDSSVAKEKELKTVTEEFEAEATQPTVVQEDESIQEIKQLLDVHFKENNGDTILDQIQTLKQQHLELKNKWQDNVRSYMDAASELNNLKQRLSQNLFTHSTSTNDLIMTPKPYTNLQNELEFHTHELKLAIIELEKVGLDHKR
ncbi:uncharacterized protein B0P05DRAFT_590619 [Gilbertella persicaria]|uniref:Uncharacterized protein n=1 Tax=Rhizopus stolonifer TaxID=4846 RepID=A0A367KVU7_RHIST|nr:uncharacterized protein B0P05DRAFT_590619 [Gilbertella persicaria]KAI8061881.1 hypothetical protein B0P05DRAFT_590619 [Gilbertella persicaria]RCI06333.1 hypothetical protein CU098_011732 [Rhizopus stolonifer]